MARARLVYLGSKLVQMVIVLWAIATILFLIFRLMPGSPLTAYIDPTFTKEQEDAVRQQFGLDKPLIVQYGIYLKNLVQGDFGISFFQKKPVWDVLMEVFPNTVILTGFALLIAACWPIPGHRTRPGAYLAGSFGTPLKDFFDRFAGLATLINPFRLFDGDWTLLAVHFGRFADQQQQALDLVVGSVVDSVRQSRLEGHVGSRGTSPAPPNTDLCAYECTNVQTSALLVHTVARSTKLAQWLSLRRSFCNSLERRLLSKFSETTQRGRYRETSSNGT